MSTIQCSCSISGYSGAISLNVRWNKPSVNFMMLSLVKHVTFLRLLTRAYSNAYRTIRSLPGREISLRHCGHLVGLTVLDAAVDVFLVLCGR